jgi:L-fuconolactonase
MPARRTKSTPRGGATWRSWPRARNVSVKLGGNAEPRRRAQFPRASGAAEFYGLVGGLAAQCRTLYRVVRCRTLQFLEQFTVGKMGTGYATLWSAFKRITGGCSQTEKLTLYSGAATRPHISPEAGRIAEPHYSSPRIP